MLVTSREPLGVNGEHVRRVASLDAATAGVELFRERHGGPVDESLVAELCARLDGIPLAIELAAGCARSLGVAEVLANLDDRLQLLVGGRRARGRQATLHATLTWSHQLLAADEKALLRRLAVFAGGLVTSAIDAVCGRDEGSRPLLQVLASLVDKSLVSFESVYGLFEDTEKRATLQKRTYRSATLAGEGGPR